VARDGDRPSIQRDLQARAREHALASRIEQVEQRLARLGAAIDGASVTLGPGAGWLRPPAGPDPAFPLQRIAEVRDDGATDDGR
jgi:hypothetical protein